MDQRLTKKHEQTLLKWIEKPRSRLHLLYKVSRDGCAPANYHQKCDNTGPTVTVVYNTAGYVFGGYTSLTLQPTQYNTFRQDNNTFLFRLDEGGKFNPVIYHAIQGVGGIHDASNYGPAFRNASSFDLALFNSNTINPQNDIFTLNTQSVFGVTGNVQGFVNELGHTTANLSGSCWQIHDLEVYSIEAMKLLADDQPWRKTQTDWSTKTRESLKAELQSYSPINEVGVFQARVLMVGQIGAGKSSFYNTINSIFRGHVTGQAVTGSAPHSLTTKYRAYEVRLGRGRGKSLNIRLCDTMGLEEEQGLDVTDVCYLLDGNIQDRFQFNPAIRINQDSPGFVRNPQLKDKVHCVLYVMDASSVSVMSTKIMEKMAAIRLHLNQRSIPLLVILTKIDKVCPYVAEDVCKVYHSMAVDEKVLEVSEKIGIPRSQVFPVKNYEWETELDPASDVLTLSTLRQIFRYTDSFFDEQLDIILAEEMEQQMNTHKKGANKERM